MTTTTLLIYVLAAVAAATWLRSRKQSPIPTIAEAEGVLSSHRTALRFLGNATDVVARGCHQFPEGVFRLPTLFRWEYVANGLQRLSEIAAAPENILSFHDGAADSLQTEYTIGAAVKHNPYHVATVRGSLTRNLARCFPDVRDEIVHAFNDVLALEGKEWKSFHVLPQVMQIVARTSNRLFVGLPLCRNQEFLDLNVNYTIHIFTRGQLIKLIPEFLKPTLAPWFSSKNSSLRHALKFLGPLLEERLAKDQELGADYPDRPNDAISWLLDIATDEERTVPALALRILVINMAAIHTSSTTLTSALYDLTMYPEHMQPMREEAERVIAEEGWSKASLASMHKIDSFLRESQRLSATGALGLTRRVVAKDGFTFSDGTTVPHGAFLSVPANAIHGDPDNYENPEVFDGFRFSRHRKQGSALADPEDTNVNGAVFTQHMVTTSPEHVAFGHGRHACPGRFFAATELKAMLAHMLINYDVKADVEGVRPSDMVFGAMRTPSATGKIMIRRRV
ncbi:cytochrome P450 [Mycena belliarum]|uniref:Cytochrome P450 n=1 Tax=Mycena belliarum TaxID=1033014 RepID=A0AAD6U4N3_9AGAR|nr:cytochrome P450 [Mycena belliae]